MQSASCSRGEMSDIDEDGTTTLYRPVGLKELELIRASDFTAFPQRLEGQPIFYPVVSEEYANHIARDWNAKYNADRKGYVTRFRVRKSYLEHFVVQTVGGSSHQEYWIPAEGLVDFNQNIVGRIEVIAEFTGADER
jgi:hypothetical protein